MFGAARIFSKARVRREAEGRTPPPVQEAALADVTRLLRREDEAGAAMVFTAMRHFRH